MNIKLDWKTLDTPKTFIAFNPFLSVEGRSPLRDPCGPYSVSPSGKILGQAPTYVRRNPQQIRSLLPREELELRVAMGRLSKTAAGHVSWQRIRDACHFRSLAQIQRALATIVADTSERFVDLSSLGKLTEYCDQEDIFFPSEGFLQPSMEILIGQLIESLGETKVLLFDEFGIPLAEIDTRRLSDRPSVVLEVSNTIRGNIGPARFSTLSGSLQGQTGEGLFYTMLRTVQKDIEEKMVELFDGFWCESSQASVWWLPRISPIV